MSEQPVTTSKRLVLNTLFNVAALLSNAVVSFFMIRFLLGQLGEVRYGVWVLIGGSIFRYAPLLSVGLNSSINRYIPIYLARGDSDGIQRVINTSLFVFTFLAVVLVIASLVIYHNIDSWFVIEPELVKTAGILVLVVGFCIAFSMPLQPSTAVLSGLQRYDLINVVVLAALLVRTLLVVALLLRGYGLLTAGTVMGLSEIVVRLVHSAFVARLLPAASLSAAKIDLRLLWKMVPYGINTFLYAMGAVIILNASTLIIGIFIGTAEISQFAAASAGVMLLSLLLGAFTAAIKPAVSDLDARDEQATVKEIAFLTQKYCLLLIIPSVAFLVLMGREFLWIWVGDKFKDPSVIDVMASILAILAVGHCMRLTQHSNFLVLVGRGQHRIFGVITVSMAILCVSASVVSVGLLDWGLIGIAWSNFLPQLLISGIILPIYFNWKMHISALESVRNVWWPAVLGSLPVVAMIGAWKYLAPPDSWPEIVGVVITAMGLTLVGGWFISLKEVERKRFKRIVLRR
ncbi:MAG: lipopolysaccharide biosynthesis protein [Planctomycetota bacterium]|jgi:O-antigen/teichoic acid export membrane protein